MNQKIADIEHAAALEVIGKMADEQKKHGGKRDGAGRPPGRNPEKSASLYIRCQPELVAAIDDCRENSSGDRAPGTPPPSRSEWIRVVLQAAVMNSRERRGLPLTLEPPPTPGVCRERGCATRPFLDRVYCQAHAPRT